MLFSALKEILKQEFFLPVLVFYHSFSLKLKVIGKKPGGTMKHVKNLVFLILLIQNNLFPAHFNDLLQDFLISGNHETTEILGKTKQAVQKLEEAVTINTEKLKDFAEQKSKELQKRAEDETKKITERYEQEATKLHQAVQDQSKELKSRATEQILALISRAEVEALKAKQQARQSLLKEKIEILGNGTPSMSWKDKTRKEFTQNIQFLKDIIIQGETPQEAKEFLNLLEDQVSWMDTTLVTTQKQSDESYIKLVQKTQLLERVAQVQKDSEPILKQRIETEKETLPNLSRLRLLLLYDINDTLQQKRTETGVPALLSPEEQDQLINRVILTASKETKPVIDESIKQELDKTKNLLTQAKEETMAIKQATTQKIEGESKSKLTLETQVRKVQAELNQQEQKIAATTRHIKMAAGQKLENLARHNLEQQTIILDTNQKLVQTKQKLINTQSKVLVQRKGRLHADKKVDLISDLLDRRVQETRYAMDTKKTFLDEQMHRITEREKMLIRSLTQKAEEQPTSPAPPIDGQLQEQKLRDSLEQELARRDQENQALRKQF